MKGFNLKEESNKVIIIVLHHKTIKKTKNGFTQIGERPNTTKTDFSEVCPRTKNQ